jgi:hypothetical protein
MFDSFEVYGTWLIGGIAGLVAFFVTAAIMGIVVRRRDRIRMERRPLSERRPLPGTIQPIQPMPLEPMRSQAPARRIPHVGWLLGFLALALAGAVMVALSVFRLASSNAG